MRMTVFLAFVLSSLALACDKPSETPPSATPSEEAQTGSEPQKTEAPEIADSHIAQANKGDINDETVLVLLGDDEVITVKDLQSIIAPLKESKHFNPKTLREALNQHIDNILLAREARKANFQAPEDAKDVAALAQAWLIASFKEKGLEAVQTEDLERWFGDQRGVARIIVKTQEEANKFIADYNDRLKADPSKKERIFSELKKEQRIAIQHQPDGILVGIDGRTATGDAVISPPLAEALFALEEDYAITDALAVGSRYAVLQRLAARPATPLDKVPHEVLEQAKDRLAVKNALNLARAHARSLRKEANVVIDRDLMRRFQAKEGLNTMNGRSIKLRDVKRQDPKKLRYAPGTKYRAIQKRPSPNDSSSQE